MDIKLLSYNIQSWDVTQRRIDGIIDLIKRHNADVVCLQEVTPQWFTILKKALGETYYFAGRDRYHGDKEIPTWRREKNCVLFKKNRFEMLYSHTYWMGPDLYHQCKIEESTLNRIFTCVGLRDKKTQKTYQQICTHLEFSTPISREKQATILADYLKDQKGPMLLAGDFNSEPNEEAYKLITKLLKDVGLEFKQEEKTYHAYGKEKAERIDFIFRSEDIKVKSFKLVKEEYEGLPPSDHYPTECIFEI